MLAPVIVTTRFLNGGCLAGKHGVTVITKVIIVRFIVRKTYAASVRIRVSVKVTVNTHVGCHFGETRTIGVRVRWHSSTCHSLPLAFLVLP